MKKVIRQLMLTASLDATVVVDARLAQAANRTVAFDANKVFEQATRSSSD